MCDDEKKTIFWQTIFVMTSIMMVSSTASDASSFRQDVKEGNALYQEGSYAASKEKYRQAFKKAPESDIVNFNFATALYKDGKYQESMDHFQKVFLSEDEELKEKAYYNSGNTMYQLGVSHEKQGDVALAVGALEKSLSQYERALAINETDDDAKHNYDFVQEELIRLKEKQKQQQQQQQQGQEQKRDQSEQSENTGDQQNQQQQESQQGQEQKHPEEQEGQQNQQGHEQGQQEEANQQTGRQETEEDKNQPDERAQPQSATQLTQEEARMRLESYQQAEEPQGQLNMQLHQADRSPVLKDW